MHWKGDVSDPNILHAALKQRSGSHAVPEGFTYSSILLYSAQRPENSFPCADGSWDDKLLYTGLKL